MSAKFNHAYALLIAVNESIVPHAALPDVIKDVTALHDVLAHPQRCGYPADHIKVIAGAASTRDGILDGLDWLRQQLQNDTSDNATAVIYYTGHGHVEGSSYYLVPYNVNQSRIRTSCLRAEDFAAAISEIQPKRLLVILDCCHSAGMGIKDVPAIHSAALPVSLFSASESGASPAADAKDLADLPHGAGRAILTSSQADQKSYVRKDGRMSIFTYNVIEALTGHAQPALGTTEVLVSDVMSHIYRQVPRSAMRDWQAPQQPDYHVSGNFPIALLLGGKGLGKSESPPDPLDAPNAGIPPAGNVVSYNATLKGSGAIAQGHGATAVGTGGVIVKGNNSGYINAGTQSTTNYFGASPAGSDHADSLGLIATPEGRRLQKLLNEFWDKEDIEGICFEMGVDMDNLRGETKAAIARSLVLYAEKNDRLDELKRFMRLQRPNLRDQLQ